MKQDYFKSYKYFKLTQLIILVVFAIAFFLFLYEDENLRYNVYSNRSLLTLCVFLWAFMLYSAITILWDFHQLEGNILHDGVLSRAAYVDSLTGIPNRSSCDLIYDKYNNKNDISNIGCALVSISNLKDINEKSGREAGNVALQDFSHIIEKVSANFGFVGRNSGNEFLCVIEKCDRDTMDSFKREIDAEISKYNTAAGRQKLDIVIHDALNSEEQAPLFSNLVTRLYTISKEDSNG